MKKKKVGKSKRNKRRKALLNFAKEIGTGLFICLLFDRAKPMVDKLFDWLTPR